MSSCLTLTRMLDADHMSMDRSVQIHRPVGVVAEHTDHKPARPSTTCQAETGSWKQSDSVENEIDWSDHEKGDKVTVPDLRARIPKLMRLVFGQEDDSRIKVRNMWRQPPECWPQGLCFGDPNNKCVPAGKNTRKPGKKELAKMYDYLMDMKRKGLQGLQCLPKIGEEEVKSPPRHPALTTPPDSIKNEDMLDGFGDDLTEEQMDKNITNFLSSILYKEQTHSAPITIPSPMHSAPQISDMTANDFFSPSVSTGSCPFSAEEGSAGSAKYISGCAHGQSPASIASRHDTGFWGHLDKPAPPTARMDDPAPPTARMDDPAPPTAQMNDPAPPTARVDDLAPPTARNVPALKRAYPGSCLSPVGPGLADHTYAVKDQLPFPVSPMPAPSSFLANTRGTHTKSCYQHETQQPTPPGSFIVTETHRLALENVLNVEDDIIISKRDTAAYDTMNNGPEGNITSTYSRPTSMQPQQHHEPALNMRQAEMKKEEHDSSCHSTPGNIRLGMEQGESIPFLFNQALHPWMTHSLPLNAVFDTSQPNNGGMTERDMGQFMSRSLHQRATQSVPQPSHAYPTLISSPGVAANSSTISAVTQAIRVCNQGDHSMDTSYSGQAHPAASVSNAETSFDWAMDGAHLMELDEDIFDMEMDT